jgi:hypothetical protein
MNVTSHQRNKRGSSRRGHGEQAPELFISLRKEKIDDDADHSDDDMHENDDHYSIPLSKLLLQKESQIVFNVNFDLEGCKFANFSQRRFIGFRKHFEFDTKRILIANKKKLVVLGLKSTQK